MAQDLENFPFIGKMDPSYFADVLLYIFLYDI